jgi:hypothetical protein
MRDAQTAIQTHVARVRELVDWQRDAKTVIAAMREIASYVDERRLESGFALAKKAQASLAAFDAVHNKDTP